MPKSASHLNFRFLSHYLSSFLSLLGLQTRNKSLSLPSTISSSTINLNPSSSLAATCTALATAAHASPCPDPPNFPLVCFIRLCSLYSIKSACTISWSSVLSWSRSENLLLSTTATQKEESEEETHNLLPLLPSSQTCISTLLTLNLHPIFPALIPSGSRFLLSS